jgi:micrococcal nuclease
LPRTLLGQRVTLVTDPTQDVRDRYDRLLADVRLADGRDYSIEAARAGAARSYVSDRPVVEHAAIVAAEAEAHDARRGLWGACP